MTVQTRNVETHKFKGFWNKAVEFHKYMKNAEGENDWNAAALNAIHCAISSADALCVFYRGERSVSQRHEDAYKLLRELPVPSAEEKAKQFVQIISSKNLVEYSDDEPSEKDARKLVLQTDRFFSWAKDNLKL